MNQTRRQHSAGIVALALLLTGSGCYGPFNLTRRLYHWNQQIGDKWENELVFLLLLLPYGFSSTADAVVFNAMEFWTGNNPVPPLSADPTLASRRIVRGDEAVLLTRERAGAAPALVIERFHQGQRIDAMRLERHPGSGTFATDLDGRVIRVARLMPDGQLFIMDGTGRRIAAYSPRTMGWPMWRRGLHSKELEQGHPVVRGSSDQLAQISTTTAIR